MAPLSAANAAGKWRGRTSPVWRESQCQLFKHWWAPQELSISKIIAGFTWLKLMQQPILPWCLTDVDNFQDGVYHRSAASASKLRSALRTTFYLLYSLSTFIGFKLCQWISINWTKSMECSCHQEAAKEAQETDACRALLDGRHQSASCLHDICTSHRRIPWHVRFWGIYDDAIQSLSRNPSDCSWVASLLLLEPVQCDKELITLICAWRVEWVARGILSDCSRF